MECPHTGKGTDLSLKFGSDKLPFCVHFRRIGCIGWRMRNIPIAHYARSPRSLTGLAESWADWRCKHQYDQKAADAANDNRGDERCRCDKRLLRGGSRPRWWR